MEGLEIGYVGGLHDDWLVSFRQMDTSERKGLGFGYALYLVRHNKPDTAQRMATFNRFSNANDAFGRCFDMFWN